MEDKKKKKVDKQKTKVDLISIQKDVLDEKGMGALLGGNEPPCFKCLAPGIDPKAKYHTTESN